jgi:hypothetical protein
MERPEFATEAFEEALQRKHKLVSEIEIKKDILGSLKRREHHITDEEREKMRERDAELKKLEQNLKDVGSDLERFTPVV